MKKFAGLSAIVKAHATRVSVRFLSDFTEGNEYFQKTLYQLNKLYDTNNVFKESVLSIVPKRLKKQMDTKQLRLLADYALQEVAIIIANPSVKVGPITEQVYDNLSTTLDAGKRKSFRYPSAGTPYTTPQGIIEPYNVTNPSHRVLISDTARDIEEKAERIHENQGLNERRRFDNHLLTVFETVRDKKYMGSWLHIYSNTWTINRSNLYTKFEENILLPIQAEL